MYTYTVSRTALKLLAHSREVFGIGEGIALEPFPDMSRRHIVGDASPAFFPRTPRGQHFERGLKWTSGTKSLGKSRVSKILVTQFRKPRLSPRESV
jgi:hypothetical protein